MGLMGNDMAVRAKTGMVRVSVERAVVRVAARAMVTAGDNMTNNREVIYYILVEGSVRLFARVDGDEAASLRALLLQPMATHELRRRVAGMRVRTQIVTSSPAPTSSCVNVQKGAPLPAYGRGPKRRAR